MSTNKFTYSNNPIKQTAFDLDNSIVKLEDKVWSSKIHNVGAVVGFTLGVLSLIWKGLRPIAAALIIPFMLFHGLIDLIRSMLGIFLYHKPAINFIEEVAKQKTNTSYSVTEYYNDGGKLKPKP